MVKVTVCLESIKRRSQVGVQSEGATGSPRLLQLHILAGSRGTFATNLLELTFQSCKLNIQELLQEEGWLGTIQKLKETLTLQYMVYLKYWCQIMGPPLPTGVSGVFEAEWSEEFAHSSIPPCIKWTCQKAVQTVKGLKKMNESWKVRLLRFLIKYRVTPQQTNGIVPAELLMCRRIRTHLDLLDPTVQQQVKEWLISQKERRDANPKPKNFEQGDWVLSRNFGQEPKCTCVMGISLGSCAVQGDTSPCLPYLLASATSSPASVSVHETSSPSLLRLQMECATLQIERSRCMPIMCLVPHVNSVLVHCNFYHSCVSVYACLSLLADRPPYTLRQERPGGQKHGHQDLQCGCVWFHVWQPRADEMDGPRDPLWLDHHHLQWCVVVWCHTLGAGHSWWVYPAPTMTLLLYSTGWQNVTAELWHSHSPGGSPYAEILPEDLYTQLHSGMRMPKPPHCAQEV